MRIINPIRRRGSPTGVVARTVSVLGAPLLTFAAESHMQKGIALSRLNSILIVRLDEIGDLVLTTPFLRELRRNAPKAWVTLVVSPKVASLFEACPYVDELLTFDPRARRMAMLMLHARALMLASKALWRRRFDLAVLPRFDVDLYHATFLGYFSGAANRVGYSEKVNCQKRSWNAGFDRLLTHAFDDPEPKHEVERNLNLICFLGGAVRDDRLELWLTEGDRSFAERILTSSGVRDGDFLVAYAPGSREAKRRWPPNRLVELGRYVLREFASRLVVVGGPDEEEFGTWLEAKLGHAVINVAGRAGLRQTAAVLERCRLTVANDSGPMHLAAAVGNPVVEISCHPQTGAPDHRNSPVRFRPWGVPCAVLQPARASQPCVDACEGKAAHCILGVTVEQVCEAIHKLALQCSIMYAPKAGLSHAG